MSAKNVKTLRAAHESWNKRDFGETESNNRRELQRFVSKGSAAMATLS